MKIKEQYTHILYAKQEWQEQLKISEYIPSKYCSKKLQQYLLKNYCNWEISECFIAVTVGKNAVGLTLMPRACGIFPKKILKFY